MNFFTNVRSFDKVFDHYCTNAFDQLSNVFDTSFSQLHYGLTKVDNGYTIEVSVAGFNKSELSATYNTHTTVLNIYGKKDPSSKSSFFRQPDFHMSKCLDEIEYDLKIVSITAEDGVLTIQLAKVEDPANNIINITIE
jgi:HSP20 family molecular chaperone IbpA